MSERPIRHRIRLRKPAHWNTWRFRVDDQPWVELDPSLEAIEIETPDNEMPEIELGQPDTEEMNA